MGWRSSREFGDVERARVAGHILRAETYTLQRRPRLKPLQRLARTLLLRELRRYRASGRFPKNLDFIEPTPYFVDAEGSRCAVAHLLDASGERGLVQRIALERNHARVAELADEPRLVAWLDQAGLSLQEAALIQPSYCFYKGGCVCDYRSSGYFDVVTTAHSSDRFSLARVEVIYGKPASSAVAVGDMLRVTTPTGAPEVGTELVVSGEEAGVDENGDAYYSGKTFPYSCGGESTPKLSKEQYLAAVLADDCKATLDTYGDWQPHCSDGCSCRAVGGRAPTSLGIVLSLLGLAIGRRMRRMA